MLQGWALTSQSQGRGPRYLLPHHSTTRSSGDFGQVMPLGFIQDGRICIGVKSVLELVVLKLGRSYSLLKLICDAIGSPGCDPRKKQEWDGVWAHHNLRPGICLGAARVMFVWGHCFMSSSLSLFLFDKSQFLAPYFPHFSQYTCCSLQCFWTIGTKLFNLCDFSECPLRAEAKRLFG